MEQQLAGQQDLQLDFHPQQLESAEPRVFVSIAARPAEGQHEGSLEDIAPKLITDGDVDSYKEQDVRPPLSQLLRHLCLTVLSSWSASSRSPTSAG